MDLVGALVRSHALQVVHVPHHGVVEGYPVTAEDRAGFACDLDRFADIVELPEGDLLWPQGPLVLHTPEVQGQERALVDLQHHVDELLLGELEGGYGLAELLAPLGVSQGALEAAPRRPHRAPDYAITRLVEAGERSPKALGAGQDSGLGEPHALQEQVALHRGAHTDLVG